MTVTLTLPPGAERVLRERATVQGQSLENYLEQLAVREAATAATPVSDEEFDATLDHLATLGTGLPVQEGKLDRAELYTDHD
ncbi:MAG: hypothetical protein ACRDJ9_17110 [Dehalococcoidia bacterium]